MRARVALSPTWAEAARDRRRLPWQCTPYRKLINIPSHFGSSNLPTAALVFRRYHTRTSHRTSLFAISREEKNQSATSCRLGEWTHVHNRPLSVFIYKVWCAIYFDLRFFIEGMEYLLSSAFDQLSSYDPSSIRRGLRHIEGLLAHICRPHTSSPRKSHSAVDTRIVDDPAYGEFLRLQDGFEWNIALRLVSCLERLLGQDSNDLASLLILSALDLLQGVLLIHAPSRRVFAREVNMTILLDLLEPKSSSAAIQGATVSTLVCALVGEWRNIRTFEALDGLASICTLFIRKDTDKEVKLKILEFLFFYLIPEEPQPSQSLSKNQKADNGSGGSGTSKSSASSNASVTRTTQEKQKMLGKYLSNVDSLVNELRQSRPFGDLAI